ncbi:MAG: OmpH family outer membrane protein [Prevotellaceae bacterium]|jgi:outer membrane protein|nr:OmpH family outer membrane protein [Prevotellaceae bacterium]
MSKKLVFLLFLAMPFFAFSQNTQIKLGYLDVQSLFLALPEITEIEATMKKLTEQHEGEIKRLEDEYQRKLEEYQKNQQTWDESIRKSRVEELQALQMKMQNFYQTAQQSLQQKQEELQAPLREKIMKAMREVGAENGFLYIFEANSLLFKSDEAIDVTPLVKKKLGVQ